MGTNATIVISDRGHDGKVVPLVGLYALRGMGDSTQRGKCGTIKDRSPPCYQETTMDRMPAARRLGQEHETDVGFLVHAFTKAQAGEPMYLIGAQRRVMGLGLPSWQREKAWSDAQCQRFIQSAWTGVPLGFWILNVVDADASHPLEGLVIDGQQRLRALERYITGEIAVPAQDGTLLHWNDLNGAERRRFERTRFPHVRLGITNEIELQGFYDTFNFSGTPHQAHERAVGRSLDTEGVALPPTEVEADQRHWARPR